MVVVAVQLSVPGSYLPPVFRYELLSHPPQTIICWVVLAHTAVCQYRAEGSFVVLVAVQVPVPGSYLPPVLSVTLPLPIPPQTIISLPVHTAVWKNRPSAALVVLVAVQLSVLGLYLPPVFKALPLYPPHTIISVPVQTAV